MAPVLETLVLWCCLGQTSPPSAWPQWRGPTGDSVATSLDLPLRWGPKENVIWRTPIPGWGTSTPAVWDEAVFITTQVDDQKLLLLRLDARSGKIMWTREVGEGTPRRKGPVGVGRFHDEHNMASPSPTTDGKHVWVHFGNGDLACYDFAGEKQWACNLTERYGVYSIWWGHANSPILVGDLLITACMQDPKGGGKSYVVALDKLTGKEVWYVERDTGAREEPADSYVTPILYHAKDRSELI
ncbi:MAG: PQQ-like beta-propeller repeat protein, partial [Gemmataceae bacterium]|nr:PQQ-like beta-propeller repeat protein [Gemmataceae bacterium]